VSQALERVRQVARQRKKEKFTALLHHVGVDLLGMAFFALKRDAAPGVDGLTWRFDDDPPMGLLLVKGLNNFGPPISPHFGVVRKRGFDRKDVMTSAADQCNRSSFACRR
jgi:hypothetical protein